MAKKKRSKKTELLHDSFFQEWLIDHNAGRSYKKAYKHKKITMATHAAASKLLSKLLNEDKYMRILDERTRKLEETSWLTEGYVLNGLKDMTEKCMQKKPVMEFDYIEKEIVQKTAIDDDGKEIGVFEFDSRGAAKGYELLGKHRKMFTDKIDLNATLTKVNAVIVIGEDLDQIES